MDELEAMRLVNAMRRCPSNIDIPSDPHFALQAMETVLTRPQKPTQTDLNVSGYHPTVARSEGFMGGIDDYKREQKQISDVIWFYKAGNTITETAEFFEISYTQPVNLLRKGKIL